MLRTAIKGVLAHKLRLALTALSIVLGVSFVAGTFVFTDTISARFDSLFTDVYAGVDVAVRPVEADFGNETSEIPFDVVADVANVDGVAAVSPNVEGYAQLIAPDGEPIGGQGPPTIGLSWPTVPALNPLRIEDGNGRAPAETGEIVIDLGTAEANGFQVGDSVDVIFTETTGEFEIVGLASFGDEDSLAGATLAVFELTEAQRVMGMEGSYTTIDIEAAGGVDPAELAARVQPTLQADLEAVTGAQQTQEQVDEVAAGLGFINMALLAFAGVAIFVGAFIIQNTFRIIVAQRTRELALMRAIGATGRQIVSMVVLEAFVVGLVASAAGVLGGVGLSTLLKAGMDSLGFGMPEGPLTVLPRTVIVAMAVGLFVTLASALIPAIAAARVAPVAAIRSSGAPSRRPLGRRAAAGTLVAAAGASLLGLGLFGNPDAAMTVVAAGALVLFVGVSVLTPLLVRPISVLVGWPVRLFGGITGRLAQENTGRQPRRTAATASALMIGIALVAFVSIFAASVKASVAETMEEAVPADLAVHSTVFGAADIGVNPMIRERLAELDELRAVSATQAGTMRIEGTEQPVAAVDPATIESVYSLGVETTLADLGSGLFVLDTQLEERGWSVGDRVAVEFALTGSTSMEIEGSFTEDSFANFLITTDTYRENFGSPFDSAVFARVADGVALSDAEAAVERATADFATVDVQTKSELIASAEAEVNTMVVLFQGLLGLAIVIAVLGIANTLALSIVERTRELGLLRALGMGRRQVRRMVRWEAVFIGFLGGLLGIGVGSLLGWAVVEALAEDGLSTLLFPGADLAGYVVLGAFAGVIAAIGPARKAAGLDVLDAISYE